jgi:hypothetical protein
MLDMSKNPMIEQAMSEYWAAYRSGDVDAMQRAWTRYERLVLAQRCRRTTQRLLAPVVLG